MPEKLCSFRSRSLWRQECKDEESIKRHGKRFYFVKDTNNLVMRSEQWGPCVDCCGDLYHGVLRYLLLEKYMFDRSMTKEYIKDEVNDDLVNNMANTMADLDGFIDSIMMRDIKKDSFIS